MSKSMETGQPNYISPSTAEKICEWRKQTDGVQKLDQNKHFFFICMLQNSLN